MARNRTAAVEFARLDRAPDVPSSTMTTTVPPTQRSVSADHTPSSQPKSTTKQVNSIRFCAHFDTRSPRPSLHFSAISRVAPSETSIIKVGRYSEREEKAAGRDLNQGSVGPVGFKSKVVSRRHCEFWCKGGQWFIKDCASSSGTFLNHIRLSQPNIESRPFPVNDGDLIQLGIDFKGGEEMIFRCVKIRIEINRGWQNVLNSFNMNTHKQLRSITKATKGPAVNPTQSTECSICLNAVAPCQSLFVAPCSHVWHFKCIRPILNGVMWPQFLCPNCRAVSDLEAEVDEPVGIDDWQDDDDEEEASAKPSTPLSSTQVLVPTSSQPATANSQDAGGDRQNNGHPPVSPFGDWIQADAHMTQVLQAQSAHENPIDAGSNTANSAATNLSVTEPPNPAESMQWTSQTNGVDIEHSGRRLDAVHISQPSEGPMTPRNDAGPFVFDGSGGRVDAQARPNA